MHIMDTDGAIQTDDEDELVARLLSVRSGAFGAFFMYRTENDPTLSVFFNGDLAYIVFFPADDDQGYQPKGMTPPDYGQSSILQH